MPRVRWLHVSDLHFGQPGTATAWDTVRETMVDGIRQAVVRDGPIDFIAVTGDIAFSGKEDQYALADRYLEHLKSVTQSRHVVAIPGNHDLQRPNERDPYFFTAKYAAHDRDAHDTAVSDSSGILEYLHKRFTAYSQWWTAHSRTLDRFTPGLLPGDYSATINIRGASIGIVGLNSSAGHLIDANEGDLWLHRNQLHRVCSSPEAPSPSDWAAQHHLSLLLTHHPPNWLSPLSREEYTSEIYTRQRFTAHLFGHTHEAAIAAEQIAGGTRRVTLQARSFFGMESFRSQSGLHIQRSHGFSIVEWTPKADRASLTLRGYEAKLTSGEWRLHNDSRLGGDITGAVELDVFRGERSPPLPTAASATADAPRSAEPTHATPPRPAQDESRHRKNPSAPQGRASEHSSRRVPRLDCDSPPSSSVWVGRTNELRQLRDPQLKVVAITGIGGQGKSMFAAHFLELTSAAPSNRPWDWRDCREQGDTLQTHILRIIERLTDSKVQAHEFSGAEPAALVSALFDALDTKEYLFVFDNVDHYIDLEAKKPTNLLGMIVESALKRRHNAQFILTCRPVVDYADPAFFALQLGGLTSTETLDLFSKRGVQVSDPSIAQRIEALHRHTQGHPLWLNLVATQVARDPAAFDGLIANAMEGKGGVPIEMLRSIWKTLNNKQQTILRSMAETLRPESEEQLSRFVDLSYNQFSRAVRTLRALDLIVVKIAPHNKDTLDLHPLIRSFIRQEFPARERAKFIERIARSFELIISKFKSQLSSGLAFGVLESWTLRAELAINARRFDVALGYLFEISGQLLAAGYPEEFVRCALRLFDEIDWTEAVVNEYAHMDDVFVEFAETMSYMGRHSQVDDFIARYETSISGKSARYVALCKIRSHSHWLRGEHEAAKAWAAEGVALKRDAKLDTRFDTSHELALAQRDSGQVEAALTFFLKGDSLDAILEPGILSPDRDGQFYGNIGRCLWFQDRTQDALVAYQKSAILLQRENKSYSPVNRGWAYFWIAQGVSKAGNARLAHCFYRVAAALWKRISPTRALDAIAESERLSCEHPEMSIPSDAEAKDECQRWLAEAFKAEAPSQPGVRSGRP